MYTSIKKVKLIPIFLKFQFLRNEVSSDEIPFFVFNLFQHIEQLLIKQSTIDRCPAGNWSNSRIYVVCKSWIFPENSLATTKSFSSYFQPQNPLLDPFRTVNYGPPCLSSLRNSLDRIKRSYLIERKVELFNRIQFRNT